MLKKCLYFAAAVLMVFALAGCGSSDQVHELSEVSYSVPSSWSVDESSEDLYQYLSDADGVAFTVSRAYDSSSGTDPIPLEDYVREQSSDYSPVVGTTKDGAVSGFAYTENGTACEVYEVTGSSGDVYHLIFAVRDDSAAEKKDAVLASVHVV